MQRFGCFAYHHESEKLIGLHFVNKRSEVKKWPLC